MSLAPANQHHEPPAADRRRSPRRPVSRSVQLTGGPEQSCPPSELVDASDHGLLIRLSAPAQPVCPGDRVLATFRSLAGALHLLGRAVRSVRGDDDRWYVAVELDEMEPADRTRLRELFDAPDAEPRPYQGAG